MPAHFANRRWLLEVARNGKEPRTPSLTINNVLGLLRACQRGLGIAMLPDYLVEENGGLVQLFGDAETLALDAYFVYPEELKSVARIQVFRDFLVANRRWLLEVARNGKEPRPPAITINNVLGLLRACQRGLGIAMLPDYLVEENGGLVQLFGDADTLALDAFFVYPEELKTVARIQVFRDFLVANAQRWHF